MIGQFWTCFVEGTNGGGHFQHPTFDEAKDEAERLARMLLNQGKKVHVLEEVGYAIVPESPVEWHSMA